MICPYCKKTLIEGVEFCSKCGQTITNLSENTDNTNRYWKDIDTLNAANERKRLNAIQKSKSEAQARTLSTIRKVIILIVMMVAFVIIVLLLNRSRQEKLEFVRNDAIGNTYSDSTSAGIMFNGEKKDRIIVNIKDEKTLTYTHGNYTLQIYSNEDGYSSSWKENEIYDACDYEYVFKASLLGKITLEFNQKSYEVEINDEDGTINSINFYE